MEAASLSVSTCEYFGLSGVQLSSQDSCVKYVIYDYLDHTHIVSGEMLLSRMLGQPQKKSVIQVGGIL